MNAIKTQISGLNYEFEYERSIWPKPLSDWSSICVVRLGVEGKSDEVESESSKVVAIWWETIWKQLSLADSKLRLHLFAASPTPINAGLISRHKRLWRSFNELDPEMPKVTAKSEVEISVSEAHIRYAGICEVPDEMRLASLELMRRHPSIGCFVCGPRTKEEYETMTSTIYHRVFRENKNEHLLNWSEFVSVVCQLHGLPVRMFGPADYGALYIDTFVKIGTKEAESLTGTARLPGAMKGSVLES
jgi:hypothetical protein